MFLWILLLRCLRDAQQRFEEGLSSMMENQPPTESFKSPRDLNDFKPKLPPGPPPKTPPHDQGIGNGGESPPPPPPPPPVPPVPPFPYGGQSLDFGSIGQGGTMVGCHFGPTGVGETPGESLRSFDLPRLKEDSTPFLSLVIG